MRWLHKLNHDNEAMMGTLRKHIEGFRLAASKLKEQEVPILSRLNW